MNFDQMKEWAAKEKDRWEEMAGRRGLTQHARQYATYLADLLHLAVNNTEHERLRPSNALAVLAMAKHLAFQEWKAKNPKSVLHEPAEIESSSVNAVGYFAHVGRTTITHVWEVYGEEVERVKTQHWPKWSTQFDRLEEKARQSGLYKEN